MYDCRPRRKNKNAVLLTALFTLLSAAGLLLSALSESPIYPAELAATVAAALAVLIAGRYLLRDYVYVLDDRAGDVEFCVVEVQGKRFRTVCRIDAAEITEVARETPETRKTLRRRGRALRRFDYCVDVGAKDAVWLFLSDDGKPTAIRFSPNERMESVLKVFASARTGREDPSDGQ